MNVIGSLLSLSSQCFAVEPEIKFESTRKEIQAQIHRGCLAISVPKHKNRLRKKSRRRK